VLGLLALSAALALATAGAGGGFAAKQKLLAVRCPAGQVAEAGGDCAQIGGVEGPIESFAAAAERTAKQSARFRARTRFLRDSHLQTRLICQSDFRRVRSPVW